MVEVELLGPVRAVVDGEAVAIDSARRRALLAMLALRPGVTVSVDGLCEALWGEDLPANARGNLQSHVSRLRSSLGDGSVVLEPGGYRLALDAGGTDIGQVERAMREAAASRAASPAAAAAAYQDALARWRGPALGELAGNPAFQPDIARLDELQRTLRDDLHEARLDAGEAAAALPAIEQAARDQPLRERSQLLLVQALHLSGRSAEALRAADAYRRHLVDETGLDPGPALGELEARILQGEATGPPAPAAGVTPVPVSTPSPTSGSRTSPPAAAAPVPPAATGGALPRAGRFFGRAHELDLLSRHLASERVVTVVGTGGVGKTRLVAEALAAGEVPDGRTVVVELAPAGDGEAATAVAAALDLRATGRAPADAVVEYLAAERMLLVLDNCEHLLDEVHDLVARVVAECPSTTVLATSRSRLGLVDERVLPLGALDVEGSGSPAVQLFVDRASRARPDGGEGELAAVEQICRRLDGIPLAVELAAGRRSALTAEALRDRLDSALDLLERPVLGPDRRHATLRQVVEWSHRLLDEDEQNLLEAISVFEGGFDLAAAEEVAGPEVGRPVAVGLGRLVDASLVVTDHQAGAAARYRVLEAVRQLGRERLDARDRTAAVLSRHAAWVTRFVAALAQRSVGPDEPAVVHALARERGNVRLALRRVAAAGRREDVAALARALADLCLYRPDAELLGWLAKVPGSTAAAAVDRDAGRDGEHNDLDDLVRASAARAAYLQGDLAAIDGLARPVVDRGRGGAAVHLARHALGVAALYAGDHDAAEAWWQATVDAADASPAARLDALAGIALARCYRGDLAGARDAVEGHLALADAVDSDTNRAFGGYIRGEILLAGGEAEPACDALRSAAGLAAGSGATFVEGVALTALVAATARAGRVDDALDQLPPVLEHWRRSATWPQVWTTLRLAADVLVARGALDVAALVLDAADADPAAPAVEGADVERVARLRAAIAAGLPAADAAAVARRARILPRARVLGEALDALERLGAAR